MGLDETKSHEIAMTLGGGGTDAFGNRVSAAARANAAWKSESLVALEKAARDQEVDADAGGVSIGLLPQTARSKRSLSERDCGRRWCSLNRC